MLLYLYSAAYSRCTGTVNLEGMVRPPLSWQPALQQQRVVGEPTTVRSLFNIPTPLRWKILRFPNVTQCSVQLTTDVCSHAGPHVSMFRAVVAVPWAPY